MTDLSPEARELLRQARAGFSPGEGRLHAVRSALSAQMASGPKASPSAAPHASGLVARVLGAGGWGTGHAVGAAVLIAALGAGGIAMWKSESPPSAAPIPDLPLAPTTSTTTALPMNEAPVAGAARDGVTAAPFAVVPSSSPPLTVSRELHSPRAPAKARSKPESPHETSADPPTAIPIPPPVPVPAAPNDSLAEEVPILRAARDALDRGDASRALVLLEAHETRFPRGTLYEERLATRVQALCLLGRTDGARRAAQELERAAPRSPHLGRIRASCIAGPPSP